MDFFYKYVHNVTDAEFYDRQSFDVVRKSLSKALDHKRKTHEKGLPKIKALIRKTVANPAGTYISYSTSPEIDIYFQKMGYFHLMSLQGYDDFSEEDIFGGIPYKHYLDFVQNLAGVALKHQQYCQILLEKNPKVEHYNILTYTWYEDKTAEQFAETLNIPLNSIKIIMGCLTLDKENIKNYENEIGFAAPPYFKFGNNQITRCLHGSLYGSLFFLRKELKRRFESDYFVAVNNRERRFKKELYNLFRSKRYICVNNEIDITSSEGNTDIDAIIFDTDTKTLGLFQLKYKNDS